MRLLDFTSLLVLLLLNLEEKSAIDVWQYTTEGNRGLDESIQLFVTADGELQMAGRDTLDLEIFGSVSGQLEDFGGEVLQDGGEVDCCLGSDTSLLTGDVSEMALDTTAWELEVGGLAIALNDGGDALMYGQLNPMKRGQQSLLALLRISVYFALQSYREKSAIRSRKTYLKSCAGRVRLGGLCSEIATLSSGLATSFSCCRVSYRKIQNP